MSTSVKYGDLINFKPIETVIQLREAEDYPRACRLVETYVISDRMADILENTLLPNLQFTEPYDSRGLFVVGNYGTGKSHLMSVISALAQHGELREKLQEPGLQARVGGIAGQFQVLRLEIGASKMPLREIITRRLTGYLETQGIDYTFPPPDAVDNNKDSLGEMMALFEGKFPEKGFLVVVDELLDYLRDRKDREIIYDLNFLREVGEFCKDSRFRFIAGIQESLFDNPSFQFVAGQVRRVKDRFEQVRIAREDVSYVVSRSLLAKDPGQKALIQEYLERYAPLYAKMAQKMPEFVQLFPIHPVFIEVFERIYIAEKREILKTISQVIRDLVDRDLPGDSPGLVSYDTYWKFILDNSALRNDPGGVKGVVDKSLHLEGIINSSLPTPLYKAPALRIIHALSIHRLTTGDLYSPIGLTAEGLRDDLCLYLPLPEEEADFLKTTIESIMHEITRTVSGQFISLNPENAQYYLDLDKDIDYGAKVQERAETLDGEVLDRYYYDFLAWVLETSRYNQYSSYRIWEYELEWPEKKSTRLGWLFFGAPNERTTAQPPRDFYLYFLKPFQGQAPDQFEPNPDEVFLGLPGAGEEFKADLSLYAGAREMANLSSGQSKKIYQEKAEHYRAALKKWLDENLLARVQVTCQGVEKTLGERVKGLVRAGSLNTREAIDRAASACLAPHFQEQAPGYPAFSRPVTSSNRPQYALDALRWISSSVKTETGTMVLEALGLLEGSKLDPARSPYTPFITGMLGKKKPGQVVNRGQLVQDIEGVEYGVSHRLEPEWVVVLLAALVHSGDIIMAYPGQKIDASNLEQLTRLPLVDLVNFKHIEAPRDFPLGALKGLFTFLGLAGGLVTNPSTREQGVVELQKRVGEEITTLVGLQASVSQGLESSGFSLLPAGTLEQYREALKGYQSFLDSLQVFNTPGKLKNFRYTREEVQQHSRAVEIMGELKGLLGLKKELDPLAAYLKTAEVALPRDHAWNRELAGARQEIAALLSRGSPDRREILSRLKNLKQAYLDLYLAFHKEHRLDARGDRRKKEILQGEQLKKLDQLKVIDLMPRAGLEDYHDRLGQLLTCYSLSREELEANPLCPHCDLKLAQETGALPVYGQLDRLEEQLEGLLRQWTRTLRENLEDPMVQGNIGLLTRQETRQQVQEFLAGGELPPALEGHFLNGIKEVLQGLDKLTLSLADIRAALDAGGGPCTVEDVLQRFNQFVEASLAGKEKDRVRIVIQ